LVVQPTHPIGETDQTTLTFVLRQNCRLLPRHTLGGLRLSATTHPSASLVRKWEHDLTRWKSDPWTALGMAYFLAGDARAALATSRKGKPTVPLQAAYNGLLRAAAHGCLGENEAARRALAAGLESLSQVEGAEEPLLALALDTVRALRGESSDDVKVLAPSARLLARFGQREAAAAAFAKLAKLEPASGEWSLRLAQLQPDGLAFWNFDFDLETRPPEGSTLSARGGALHYESATGPPFVEWNVAAPPGCTALTLRVRATTTKTGISCSWTTTQVLDRARRR
jgi:hypothetical protein